MKYGINNLCDFKMYDENTKEVILEGGIPTNEAVNIMCGIKENLIPLNLKLDEYLDINIYVTKDTYDKLKECSERK